MGVDHDQKPFELVSSGIRDGIRAGEWAVGGVLPSVRELADRFDVSPGTVVKAMAVLRDEGVVATAAGRRARVSAMPAEDVTLVQLAGDVKALQEQVASLDQRIDSLESRK